MSSISYADGAISLAEIVKAAERLRDHATVTPVLTCASLSDRAGVDLFFKAEIFQRTGSFKFRGAYNAISLLPPPVKGVVTHSSGNHAAAVALAARLLGVPAHIVVPQDTPAVKMDAVKAYGGRLITCEPTIDAREAACAAVQAQTGADFIPPYNHPNVICGQGTIALELLDQVEGGPLDAVVVPISGGGMTSGIAVAAKALCPGIKVIAAEPCGRNDAADVAQAKAAGAPVPGCPRPDTICDGLQARLGPLTWPIVADLVDDVIVVTEQQVVEAMALAAERMKVVVEPSGAAGLAAALQVRGRPGLEGVRRVGVILCGGNVAFDSDRWMEAR